MPNTDSIESLYKKFSERLKLFIMKRVGDKAEAEDILHDVFLKIHAKIDTLKDNEKLESWVFQVARNTVADHFRSRKPAVEPPEDLALVQEENISRTLAPSVKEMIENLPELYREALRLTEYEGLSQKELGQRLGISLSGAKSRVQRARAMLRDMLMECCHFELDKYGTIIDYHPISCSCCNPQKPQP